MIQVDALGPDGPYRARSRVPLADVSGRPTVEMSLVPPLFVHFGLAALRAASPLSADDRVCALAAAGRAFATATIDGLTPEQYHHCVSRLSGLPITSVRAASQVISTAASTAYQSAMAGRPAAAAADWRDPRTRYGNAVWTRRGEVLAVHAAGNHPAVHALWLQALALGFKVAVRPSRREPLTPHRLVTALLESGFRNDQVLLLPTDHAGADRLIDDADLALVYGGDDVMRKYGASASVLPQGPGRSKVLLTREADWTACVDTLVDLISWQGGAACLNATAVFVEGDPEPVAKAVAERLCDMPSLPPEDEKAVLPVQPAAAAMALEGYLMSQSGDARPWLGGDGIVGDLGDGSAALRPAVFEVRSADAPQTSIELPFPCAWIAPWSPGEGLRPLRNTLALTVFTQDGELVENLIDEPTIGNVYVGSHLAGASVAEMPHDGYLSEFLMRSKSVIRDCSVANRGILCDKRFR
jgi:acyl-CoA reductase-like NAD-dependent aldehyde dehydrogenase